MPSVYESSPNSFASFELRGMPYVLYKSCRYSVPREYAYSTLKYKITTGKINIYDENLNFICTHLLSERMGSNGRGAFFSPHTLDFDKPANLSRLS
jgi:hypothetical protein